MNSYKLINGTRDTALARNIEVAGSWFSRLRGLLGRKELAEGHCLVLNPCNSIHTCFMKFNIDALFIDCNGLVVHAMQNLAPYRFSPVLRNARYVIELPANTLQTTGTLTGDWVYIEETGSD